MSYSDYYHSVANLYGDLIRFLEKKGFPILVRSPKLKRIRLENRFVNSNNTKAHAFEQQLKFFDYTLKTNFPQELLLNYLDNLEDLSAYGIYFQLANIINIEGYEGRYNSKYNVIVIDINDPRRILSIFHEFFHVASTNRSDPDHIRTGLSFINRNTKQLMGRKLNEGYTDLMTCRYFSCVGYEPGYPIQMKYAELLEQIVGKNLMEESFLTASPQKMFAELQKYDSVDSIVDFVQTIDQLDDIEKPLQLDTLCYRTASYYIIKWFVRKQIVSGYDLNDPNTVNRIYMFASQLPRRVPNPHYPNKTILIDVERIVEEEIKEGKKANLGMGY